MTNVIITMSLIEMIQWKKESYKNKEKYFIFYNEDFAIIFSIFVNQTIEIATYSDNDEWRK